MTASTPVSSARQIVGHSSIYAVGNILRQLVGFVMLPIYTRCLTPADYGVVGLMTFALSLTELLFGARLGMAIPKYYFDTQDKQAQRVVVSTAMIITGAVSAATATTLVLLRKPVSVGLYGTPEYAAIVGFFSVQLLTLVLENYALVYLRLQQRPWFFVSVNLAKLVVQLSLNIWLVVFLKMGVMGVAVSSMISGSLFALLLLVYTMSHVGWGFDRELAGKMIRFCWPFWVAGFAGLYINSANRYYLRIFSSLADVGLFELAMKFGAIISLLVWQSFAQYWQVERFRYYQRGDAEPIFQQVFYFISTLLIMAALGVSIFAGPVICIMADEAFHRASHAVPFLAFGAVFGSLILFSNFSFLIKEKTGWLSRNSYLTAVIVTIFYLAFVPVAGHVGAALAYMIARVIQFLIVHRAARKVYDMGITLKPLAFSLCISTMACAMSNYVLVREDLLRDFGVKLLVYIVACFFILLPLLRTPSARRYIVELWPGL